MILDIFAQNAHTPGGQGAGRAGAAALPAAAPARRRQRSLSQQARRHRHPVGPRRDAARGRPPAHPAPHHQARSRPQASSASTRAHAAQGARRAAACASVAIVGYTNAGKSTLLNRLTDAGVLVEDRLFATLDPTTRRLAAARRRDRAAHRHRRLRAQAAAPAGRGVQVARSRSSADADLLVHVVDARRADPDGADRRGRDGAARDRRRRGARAARVQQGRPRARRAPSSSSPTHPGSVAISAPHRRGHRRPAARRSATGCARSTHGRRAARARTTAATCSPRCTARARCSSRSHDDDGMRVRARPRRGRRSAGFAEFVGRPRDGCDQHGAADAGFVPPPYPYDRLDALQAARRRAAAAASSTCSIGTPCDPPPDGGDRARSARSDAERGYPPSIGTPALREAAAAGSTAASASTSPPDAGRRVRRHQGVRRARCRSGCACAPRPRHRAVPGGRLPDLRDGRDPRRLPRRCRCRSTTDWRLDLDAIDPSRRRRGRCACGSTARATRPARSTTSARPRRGAARHGVPVFSDECYAEFTWDGPPRTILEHGLDGVLAVHSLSKRSNLAGVRVGFYAGDPELVALPRRGAQARRAHGARRRCRPPAVAALGDDEHVDAQRARYRAPPRPARARGARRAGLVHRRPARARLLPLARAAERPTTAGRSPRDSPRRGPARQPRRLLRAAGADHVRLALVQPTSAIELTRDDSALHGARSNAYAVTLGRAMADLRDAASTSSGSGATTSTA